MTITKTKTKTMMSILTSLGMMNQGPLTLFALPNTQVQLLDSTSISQIIMLNLMMTLICLMMRSLIMMGWVQPKHFGPRWLVLGQGMHSSIRGVEDRRHPVQVGTVVAVAVAVPVKAEAQVAVVAAAKPVLLTVVVLILQVLLVILISIDIWTEGISSQCPSKVSSLLFN
jgi:hypothetical protein